MAIWGTGFFKGLAVTMRNFLRGPITLQYPEQREELPERARWALQHKFDEDGKPKCTACEICCRTCPDGILTLDYEKREDGTKYINSYVYEVGACMFCGLCVEACPFDAIEMGKDYELACRDTSGLYRTLLADVEAAGPKRKAASAPAETVPAPAEPAPAPEPAAPPAEPAPALDPEGGEASA